MHQPGLRIWDKENFSYHLVFFDIDWEPMDELETNVASVMSVMRILRAWRDSVIETDWEESKKISRYHEAHFVGIEVQYG